MSGPDQDLERLAGAAGIAVHWRDAMGREQVVAPEVLRTLLTELGFEVDTPACIADCLERLARGGGQRWPALKTASRGEPVELPGAGGEAEMPFRLLFEDGGRMSGIARRGERGALVLPGVDRPGYHTLQLGAASCTLAVAPDRCFAIADALHGAPGRLWALGVQLYGLRRETAASVAAGSAGLGDFTALRVLAEQAAARGAAAVAVSPVHAMFGADPGRYSPYSPSSRLFLNVLYADPSALFGPQAAAVVSARGLEGELSRLSGLDLIDWPAAAQAKMAVLRTLFDGFPRNVQPGVHRDFQAFEREGASRCSRTRVSRPSTPGVRHRRETGRAGGIGPRRSGRPRVRKWRGLPRGTRARCVSTFFSNGWRRAGWLASRPRLAGPVCLSA